MNTEQIPVVGAVAAVKAGLAAAFTALVSALERAQRDPAQREQARLRWREGHGVVRIIAQPALVRVSEEIGETLASGNEHAIPAASIRSACQAMLACLDEMVAGKPLHPMKLLPAYSEMQQARGIERVAAHDLFFPDLSVTLPAREPVPVVSADGFRGLRRIFEAALLVWLRNPTEDSALFQIRDVLVAVEASCDAPRERLLWWAALAIIDAIENDGLVAEPPLRRLVAQFNLQIARLAQANAGPPDALLRETLYHVARAKPVTERVREVQAVFKLRELLGADAPAPAAALIKQATAAAVSGLAQVWNAWSSGDAEREAIEAQVAALAEIAKAEPPGALAELLAHIEQAIRVRASAAADTRSPLSVEISCALLMIENLVEDAERAGPSFERRARNAVARLQAAQSAPGTLASLPPMELEDPAARRDGAKLLLSQALGETEVVLQKAESALDAYFRDPTAVNELSALDRPLAQCVGTFRMMQEDDAAGLLGECRAEILRLAGGEAGTPAARELLVKQITALAAYVSAARQGPASLNAMLKQMGLGAKVAAPVVAPVVPVAAEAVPDEPKKSVPIDGGEAVHEMLDVFLEEAEEVLAIIEEVLPQSRQDPRNAEHLGTLRRGFHTLKGSGRMVGLVNLGEAAWEIEQVLNELVQKKADGHPDLYRLLELAHQQFASWVAELQEKKAAPIDATLLCEWGRHLRAGRALPVADAKPAAAPAPRTLTATLARLSIVIGGRRINPVLFGMFLEEARQYMATLDEGAKRLANDSGVSAEPAFLRAAHTLGGISGTVGFPPLQELAASLERVLLCAANSSAFIDGSVSQAIVEVVANLGLMLTQIAASQAPDDAPTLIATLDAIVARAKNAPMPSDPASAPSSPSSAPLALQPEAAARVAEAVAAPGPALIAVPIEAASGAAEEAPASSASAPAPVPAEPDAPVLTIVHAAVSRAPVAVPADVVEPLNLTAQHDGLLDTASTPTTESAERRVNRHDDDIDAQLLEIFVTEAQELMPQIGQDLRDWRSRPADKLVSESLKRLLHTFKGSARMAGAMALGELTHAMESRVANAARLSVLPEGLFDALEASYDRLNILFEDLSNRKSAALDEDIAPISDIFHALSRTQSLSTVTRSTLAVERPEPSVKTSGNLSAVSGTVSATDSKALTAEPVAPRAMLRVRADIADRLTNQAGEVSIARSRAETELRGLRGASRELTDNIIRLRSQLREIEIQAESQMQSRMALVQEADAHFDPLEFDRFTRLQELARLLAESVNDVSTVQQNFVRNLDEGEAALTAQGHVTRQLQDELMRIRMVPFSSLNDRLYRVARLASKDVGKRVALDIEGAQVELDRSVLDRIIAPFEHLLRNAIAHGIEPAALRHQAGKPDAGQVTIEIRQEGNEIVLMLRDDGAGLDLARIREKAIGQGLIPATARLSDEQIGDLIFRAGLSTAETVSEVAGRGVGMDVVRNEIAALGGRVELAFERGKGTQFTIYLPLTLAVLRAVVLRAGDQNYAVPALMVEQVQSLKPAEMEAAYAQGWIEREGTRYTLYNMMQMLGKSEAGREIHRYNSILLLRSGALRTAVHVDSLIGGRDIVVKNIGEQLARVVGVTGAAVLDSGETVLILNPGLIAQSAARALTDSASAGQADVVETAQHIPTMLVVDDSLTVRKITTRMLEREGYKVVLAKDGVDALEKLRDLLPDVIITDVEMPRMDGFDLTRNIRADERLKDVPMIMITSRTADKHRNYARELGVNIFLGKPYEEKDLLDSIADFVGARA